MAGAWKRIVGWGVGLFAAGAAIWALSGPLHTYSLTGRFFRIHRIEPLVNPVGVVSFEPTGLRLADGRLLVLKGVARVRTDSAVLREAVRDGVEVAPDGAVVGRVRVWHWCGNDPVREDVRRVDLALLAMYMHGDGAGGRPGLEEMGFGEADQQESVGLRGWSISAAMGYFDWIRLRELEGAG